MDSQKAFGKVPHRRLLHKLDYYRIRGSTHEWMSSWLSGRSQQVVLDGQASDPVPVLSGVSHGSVLGPILLFFYLHKMTYRSISSIQFACSRTIVSCIETFILCKICLILQEDIGSLAPWNADWQMKFNVSKSHSMRVTRHYSQKQIIYNFSAPANLGKRSVCKISWCNNHREMDWGHYYISDISSKATKTLGFLPRNLAFAPKSTKEVAHITLVRS